MRHHLFSMAPPSKPSAAAAGCAHHHSPSATLDILILIIVVFAGSFLLLSYVTYVFHSLSLLLPPLAVDPAVVLYTAGLFASVAATAVLLDACCGRAFRRCGRRGCRGMKKAMEFDLQVQTEDVLRKGAREVDSLPWKGGAEGNPDYECLRAELRKMAPPNGRAVLLFRAKCGCPVAKLEGWGPKRAVRKNKKSLALNGGDHR